MKPISSLTSRQRGKKEAPSSNRVTTNSSVVTLGDLASSRNSPSPIDHIRWLSENGIDAVQFDDRARLRFVLQQLSDEEATHPAAIATRAALEMVEGNLEDAFRVYLNLVDMDIPSDLRAKLRIELVGILGLKQDMARALVLVEQSLREDPLDVLLVAHRATILAKLRDRRAFDDMERYDRLREHARPIRRLRADINIAGAYDAMGDSAAALRINRRAAALGEDIGAHRSAAIAYHNMMSYYSNVVGDQIEAERYNAKSIACAEQSKDRHNLAFTLTAGFGLAVETGRKDAAARFKLRLGAFEANFLTPNLVFVRLWGESTMNCWDGKFRDAELLLEQLDQAKLHPAQRSFVDGVRAVAQFGNSDRARAIRSAIRALRQSRPIDESVTFRRMRRFGRILACAVLLQYGRRYVAIRALEAYADDATSTALQPLADAVRNNAYNDVLATGSALTGMALVLDAARKVVAAEAPALESVTERDLKLLRYLADGKRGKEIAQELGLAPKTVDNLKSLLYQKLDVTHAIAAVAEARRRKLV